MSNSKTQPYKNTFKGSIGAGMGSIISPNGKRYYILEHRVSSKYHHAGESQEIIVDHIEIGRDSHCQVRFDDRYSTVSRHHAAIVKDGDGWKLIQISTTNTTLLNGHPVQKEWYLQNGDEIQLSINGPKLGFIIPSGNKSTVGSIGLTRRLSLFRQQALRPYKTAITVLSCLLLMVALGGGYKMYDLHQKNLYLAQEAEKQTKQIEETNKKNEALAQEISQKGVTISEMQNQIEDLKKRKPQVIRQSSGVSVSSKQVDNNAINKCLPNVFYIQALGFEITFPDGQKTTIECGSGEEKLPGWSGTGFLLSDGRFVTARHVVEAWYYFVNGGEVNQTMLKLNAIANNGGKVVAHFGVISSNGTKFTFTSEQCRCNRGHDREHHMEDGIRIVQANPDNTDYAYFNSGRSSGLPYNPHASNNLERGTKLTVLGFPLGLGANSASDISPIYGSGIVAANGLQNGVIITTDTNYEQGNSGGPVFCTNDSGELEVVGIVSASAGRNTGFIVPISVVR